MNLEDLFTVSELTSSINKLPLPPSKLGSSGLFTERSVSTTSIVVEQREGRLHLVPAASRDADAPPVESSKRSRRTFELTHLPQSDSLRPGELQNLAAFGEQTTLVQQANVINERLQSLKNTLEATREWQRIGAITGKILDADGSVIYDLYKEFDVQAKTVDCGLDTTSTDVRKQLLDAKRYAEVKLPGFTVTGWRAYTSPGYFDALTGHGDVKAAYANYQAATDRLGGDMRAGFRYGDILFEEYNAVVSGKPFIADGKARLVPIVSGIFTLTNGPANYNETANTLGLAFYSKVEPRKMGKGWELEAQSNPLALCLAPEALVELVA